MSGYDQNNRDIKKLLGNPKITFILGKFPPFKYLEKKKLTLLCRRTSLRKGHPVR